MDYPDFTGVSIRRKGGTGGFFFGVGIAFFFPSGYLGKQEFLGWILSGLTTLIGAFRPVVCVFLAFLSFFDKIAFSSEFGFWRSWFTESTILLGVRGQKIPWIREHSTKKNQKIKNREAFFLSPFSGRPDINNATCLARVTTSHFH